VLQLFTYFKKMETKGKILKRNNWNVKNYNKTTQVVETFFISATVLISLGNRDYSKWGCCNCATSKKRKIYKKIYDFTLMYRVIQVLPSERKHTLLIDLKF
jgi:hypothetical protein